MGLTAALVVDAGIWFMVLCVTLPIRLKTQGDVGEIVPGTQAGAPVDPQLGRRFRIVTLVSLALWAAIAGVIFSGLVTICDLDWVGTMAETCAARETGV